MTINQIKIIHDVLCKHTKIVNHSPHLLSRTFQRRQILDFSFEMLKYPVLMCYRRANFYGILQGTLVSDDANSIENMEYKDLFNDDIIKLDTQIDSLVCFKLPKFKPLDPEVLRFMEKEIKEKNDKESKAYSVLIDTSCVPLSTVFGLQSVIGFGTGMVFKNGKIYIEELEIEDTEVFKEVLSLVDSNIKNKIKLMKL